MKKLQYKKNPAHVSMIINQLLLHGIEVTEEQLFKLNDKPIGHLTGLFDAYAAQAGEFGIHAYFYYGSGKGSGKVDVHII